MGAATPHSAASETTLRQLTCACFTVLLKYGSSRIGKTPPDEKVATIVEAVGGHAVEPHVGHAFPVGLERCVRRPQEAGLAGVRPGPMLRGCRQSDELLLGVAKTRGSCR